MTNTLKEKHIEDLIILNPEKYLDEPGLTLIKRQYSIGNYRFDLLFEDHRGDKLIVEIQRGTLDRPHTYKILDYYDEYKEQNPHEFVDLLIVANKITRERRSRLDSYGISYKEIPKSVFLKDLELNNNENMCNEKGHNLKENHRVEKKNKPEDWRKYIVGQTGNISDVSNTLFRQNQDEPKNIIQLNYSIPTKWKEEDNEKDAIVYFSSYQKKILIVPKSVIDKYLFFPFFEKVDKGWSFKINFDSYRYSDNRMSINFKLLENSYFIVYINALRKYNQDPYILFKLPSKYWIDVDLMSKDPFNEFIQLIVSQTKELSSGEGVIPIGKIGNIKNL